MYAWQRHFLIHTIDIILSTVDWEQLYKRASTPWTPFFCSQHRNCILWTTDWHSVYYYCRSATVGEGGVHGVDANFIAVHNLLSMISMIHTGIQIFCTVCKSCEQILKKQFLETPPPPPPAREGRSRVQYSYAMQKNNIIKIIKYHHC
jgi:hypothetical protein